jgi:dethiobiotin synthetase
MSAFFITATGTDIGKTYLATTLIQYLRRNGRAVDALKPVVTGFDPAQLDGSDPALLLAALGKLLTAPEIDRVSPWRFALPAAPDLAAAREGRRLDFDALVAFSQKAIREHRGNLLIEGIGGVMVPLDDKHTVVDWIVPLSVPLILVAGSYLGSISHTLTCLDALWRRELFVRAVIINETPGATITVEETIQSVTRFARSIPVVGLKRDGGSDDAKMEVILKLFQ